MQEIGAGTAAQADGAAADAVGEMQPEAAPPSPLGAEPTAEPTTEPTAEPSAEATAEPITEPAGTVPTRTPLLRLRELRDRAGTVTRRQLLLQLGLAAPLLLGLGLWAWSLPTTRTRVDDLGGFGLAAAVPWMFWAGLGLVVAGFALTLHRPARRPLWPAAYTVALLLVQRATQALVYPTPLYAWAWKHIAIIDRLLANGGHLDIGNRLGAMAPYDQWAGFFAGNATLIRLVGLHSALSYAAWAPFVSSLLLVPPLLLVFQVFSRDRRLVWSALWIFFLGNWVGQDYLSPQAFAFFLYLGVLALVFRNLARSVPPGRHGEADAAYPLGAPPRPQLPANERRLWLLVLAAPIGAIAISHQLTPVALGVGVLVLAVSRRYRNPWLILLALMIPAAWDATSALSFFKLQLPIMARTFGDLLANSQPGDGATPTGAGPVTVAWLDRGLSGAVVLLALIGLLRHPPLRRSALPVLLVAAAPLPLAVANSYGGEMVFRVFMFALPGLSFFAAAALFPRPRQSTESTESAASEESAASTESVQTGSRWSALRSGALGFTVLALLAAVFVPSYTGKDRTDYFPRGEIQLVDQLVAKAPPGSFIVGADVNFPDAYLGYERNQYWWLSDETGTGRQSLLADPARYLARNMAWAEPAAHAYFVVTRAQLADVQMQGLLPPGALQRIEQSVAASPSFRLILQSPDGVVYQYVPTTTGVNG
ncbi:hypothetical protein ABIA33_006332 [Streptacidiphilus sp. MAP12-16]|uniref:PT domain-containing protein n=1 Tax=Streptacidiphilus sp. MAP12-16 TaxID=3156300 RepID=UPI003514BE23